MRSTIKMNLSVKRLPHKIRQCAQKINSAECSLQSVLGDFASWEEWVIKFYETDSMDGIGERTSCQCIQTHMLD